MVRACKNCAAFEKFREGDVGYCHLNPPQMIPDLSMVDGRMIVGNENHETNSRGQITHYHDSTDNLVALFPKVGEEDWCLQFQQKEESKNNG